MQTAGARALREDDQEDMSREAVLLQWERKIEAAERRPEPLRPGCDDGADSGQGGTVAELRPSEDATHEAPLRFERRAAELLTEQPVSERRTVTITGQPDARPPAPRSRSSNSQMAQPERLAPLGLPARPLPDGRGRRHRARLADHASCLGSVIGVAVAPFFPYTYRQVSRTQKEKRR